MILSGIVAASGGGFVATGGTEVLTQFGWKWHIFRSSGTFTVESGAKVLRVLLINGGNPGGSTSLDSYYGSFTCGNGGSGGAASVSTTSSAVSNSFAVTVGAASSSSSVPLSLTGTTNLNGGGGGGGGSAYWWSGGGGNNAGNGGNASNFSSTGIPWNIIPYSWPTNAGGGGGGGTLEALDYGVYRYPSYGIGGSSGYAYDFAGPRGGDKDYNGSSGPAGSGSGGGGGGAYLRGYADWQYWSAWTTNPGAGGSGTVIIAYQV